MTNDGNSYSGVGTNDDEEYSFLSNRRQFLQATGALGTAALLGTTEASAQQSGSNLLELAAIPQDSGGPTDPDNDGLYEDVNGDGEMTHDDIVELFQRFDEPEIQSRTEDFDFNQNDRLDYDDIVTLQNEIESDSSGPGSDSGSTQAANGYAWLGISPEEIDGQTNPTLSLTAGIDYTLKWTNRIGEAHNFVIVNESGDELVSTESMSQEGKTQTVEFTAREEMAAYYSESHTSSMRGSITINESPPNVVFIYIDDMGYGALTCYGDESTENPDEPYYHEEYNNEVQTENIDQLAAEGTRFTQYYTDSPICSPSRAAVMTGQYPQRHHIYSYLASSERNRNRGMANWLGPDVVTLPRQLKQTGYATGHFGKWHMGGGRDICNAPFPTEYGFDESLVSFEGLGPRILDEIGWLSEASADCGGEFRFVPEYEKTRIYVDHAIDFIERHRDQPFYIHLWPNDIHDPWRPSQEQLQKVSEYSDRPPWQRYFAVLNALDLQIGRLVDAIDEMGLKEDTMIVLSSDNGPELVPDNRAPRPVPGYTGGLRGYKGMLYEGGIREPLIVRQPGTVPAGVTNDETVIAGVDLLPTISSIAGAELPADYQSDGVDASQSFQSSDQVQPTRESPIFWEFSSFFGSSQIPGLAMRDGDWKLLMEGTGLNRELYNIANDRDESDNLVEQHPDRADQMATRLNNWYRSLPEPFWDEQFPPFQDPVISVQSPDVYKAGLISMSKSFEVVASVANQDYGPDQFTITDVTLELTGVPEDWTVTAETATQFRTVADGESVTARWEITPDSTADGDVELEVVATYKNRNETIQLKETKTLSAALIAYWTFNNSNEDSSSYDHEFTLENGAGYDDQVALEGSHSLQLDGTDDYIHLDEFGGAFLSRPFSERTVSMWINPDSTTGLQGLYNEGGLANGLAVRINDGMLEAGVSRDFNRTTIASSFTRTDWTHVGVVFEHGGLRLYVNGSEVASDSDVGYGSLARHIADSVIGNSRSDIWEGAGGYFDGHVDATAIYNSALSTKEIIQLCKGPYLTIQAPSSYRPDSESFEIIGTFTNPKCEGSESFIFDDVSLTVTGLPKGVSAESTTDTEFDSVAEGESVTARWELVRNSEPTLDFGVYEFTVEATFSGEDGITTIEVTEDFEIELAEPQQVGFWPFNEGGGETTTDKIGDNDATLVNGPTWTTGKVDDALRFDGIDDYVTTETDILDTSQDYSVAAWVKVDDLEEYQTAVSQVRGSGTAFFLQYLGIEQQFSFSFFGGRAFGGPIVETGKWYHIAGVHDIYLREASLYVNGERIASIDRGPDESDGDLLVGRATVGGNAVDFWNGTIDQVHAYQSSLNDKEVRDLYKSEK